MKNSITRILLAVEVLALIAACNEDTDWYGADSYAVSRCFGDSLQRRYPDAKYVEWSVEDAYFVASFRVEGFETEAWFNATANWVMTVSEISYKALPTAISELVDKMQLDAIFRIERPYFAQLYMLNLEKEDVIYSVQGLLVSEGDDLPDAYPVELPDAVIRALETEFPDGYQLLEATCSDGVWTMRVLVENEIKEFRVTI